MTYLESYSLCIFGPSSRNARGNSHPRWAVTLSTGYNHRLHLLFFKIKTHVLILALVSWWLGSQPQPLQTPVQTSTTYGFTAYAVYSTACSFCHYTSIITARRPETSHMQFLPAFRLEFLYAKLPLCSFDLTPEAKWDVKHCFAHRALFPCEASIYPGPKGLVTLLELPM